MDEKTANFQLLEPSRPESLVPDSPLEPWMTATAIVALVAVILFLKLRKSRRKPFDSIHRRQVAYAEASSALQSIPRHLTAREAAIPASLILRKYLSTAASDPALFETHEETISRHDALDAFSPETRAATIDGFARLAAIKYSKNESATAATELVSEASALLETLHHGFTA